jgi:hypothetical protein
MTTTETTDLAIQARDLPSDQWGLITTLAPSLHACRYYSGVNSPEQAAWLMARAYELGFPITAGPETIDAIQGKPVLKPMAALALVYRSGLLASMQVEEKPDACTITMTRTNGISGSYTFTTDDAKRAGLVKPDSNYEKWGKNMRYWRAVGFCIDRVFPDVTLGLKDSVQFGDAPPAARANPLTGEIIEGEVTP